MSNIRAELRDPTERVVEDDQGAHRAAEWQAHSLLNQQLRAASASARQPGVCANCGEVCLPLAAYCDEDCRADDEWRKGLATRTGVVR